MYNKDISPVGWYVGSYLIRFIELNSDGNDDPEKRFTAWENTIIVKAENIDEAYDKIVALAKDETKPYKGGPEGVPVQWIFEGVTDLLPIYEDLEDGAEIMYREYHPTKLKNLRALVHDRQRFKSEGT